MVTDLSWTFVQLNEGVVEFLPAVCAVSVLNTVYMRGDATAQSLTRFVYEGRSYSPRIPHLVAQLLTVTQESHTCLQAWCLDNV